MYTLMLSISIHEISTSDIHMKVHYTVHHVATYRQYKLVVPVMAQDTTDKLECTYPTQEETVITVTCTMKASCNCCVIANIGAEW